MNIGIMLSGGIGHRIGGDIPKQYIEVKGKRILYYSLDIMAQSPYIDKLCIVATQEWCRVIGEERSELLGDKLLGFANPGANRQLSIMNAMDFVIKELGRQSDSDTVFIHDAARPFLTDKMIETYIKALNGHDGVLPVIPMKDTVYMSEDGEKVSELCDRGKLFCGQAPEVFALNKYYEANRRLLPDDISYINGSAEPAVMAGLDVCMIEGCERNVKITTQSDLDNFRR